MLNITYLKFLSIQMPIIAFRFDLFHKFSSFMKSIFPFSSSENPWLGDSVDVRRNDFCFCWFLS